MLLHEGTTCWRVGVAPRAAFAGVAQVEATFRLTFSDGTVVAVPFTLLGPSR